MVKTIAMMRIVVLFLPICFFFLIHSLSQLYGETLKSNELLIMLREKLVKRKLQKLVKRTSHVTFYLVKTQCRRRRELVRKWTNVGDLCCMNMSPDG